MKAAWYERTGPANEVFIVGDKPDPEPGPDEVLVRVMVSGINPADVKLRSGWLESELKAPFIIPHSDGAGVIEKVGSNIDISRVGERVWTWDLLHNRQCGTAAEFIALPAKQAVLLPDNMTFEEGACIGAPAVTAYQAFFIVSHELKNRTVFVAGGSGAVGRYAVQFAKKKGARVITSVSSGEKARVALQAGADHVINYKTENVIQRVYEITSNVGADVILEVDFAANVETDAKILKTGGYLISYSSTSNRTPTFPYYLFAQKGPIIYVLQAHILPLEKHEQMICELNALLGAGGISHHIGQRHPLDEIATSHRAVESGRVSGKVVISFNQD